MATFKSTRVTNYDANPIVKIDAAQSGCRLLEWKGTHEITSAYTTGDILVLERLPQNLRISEIWMGWDDVNNSTLPADLGWYYPDGTVGDIDEFASALALGTATVMTKVEFEAAATDIDRMGKMAYEWFGLSDLTNTFGNMWDLALTMGTNGGTTAAGTISWIVRGTIDN